ADLYERLRGLGLAQPIAARHELALARSLVALGRTEDARTSLRRATLAGGETAAEAHAMFAEIADAALDREHAAAELDTAIAGLVELAEAHADSDRLYTRAAELAVARAMLFDKTRQSSAAEADWQRAHALARHGAPEIARHAARTLLARAGGGVASGTAAAAAWLAADEPAAALPHGARAHASLSAADVPAALRREVLVTLGEAAWRQRAWPDVVRAYRSLLEEPGAETP